MKIDDVFFAVGLIIISSLLVFVIYDDVTTIQDQISMEDLENIEANASDTINRTDNESLVMPSDMVTSSNTNLNQIQNMVNSANTQNVDSSKLTQQQNTETKIIQSSNSPENNINNNLRTHTEDLRTSNHYNSHNDRAIGQGEFARK